LELPRCLNANNQRFGGSLSAPIETLLFSGFSTPNQAGNPRCSGVPVRCCFTNGMGRCECSAVSRLRRSEFHFRRVAAGRWRCTGAGRLTDGLSARGERIKHSRPEGTQGRATYIGERRRSSPTDGHPSKILKPRGPCGVTLRSPTRCEKSLHVPTPRGWDAEFESVFLQRRVCKHSVS
jgi:hypothetical protein